jgi:lipopolysaccharide/colanic/teichoic acid biosynthesis glycosyltransferase
LHFVKLRTRFALNTVAVDTAAALVAGLLASQYVFGVWLPWNAPQFDLDIFEIQNPRPMVALLILGVMFGSWQSLRLVEPAVPRPLYARAFTAGTFGLVSVLLGTFITRTYYSLRWVSVALGGWLILALVYRAIQRRQPWVEDMVIITDEKALVEDLADSPNANVIDLLEPRGEPPPAAPTPNTTLVLDMRAVLSDQMASFVSSSTLAGYEVRPLSNVYEEHTGRVALVHLAEGWEISVPLERRAPYAPMKQVVESLLVVATSPIWAVLAALTWVAVKLDSPGPAVFKQRRTGLNDKPFTMYKFRTMVLGADDDGPQFTSPDDPRITRIGRFLRSTRLDEIPQLLNILKGDAALVGPRAEQLAFVQQFERLIPFYRYRHLVRPGITGWAQVNSGYADDLNDTIEKLTYDLYYVRHMSPWLDLSILAKTLATVIGRNGAQ